LARQHTLQRDRIPVGASAGIAIEHAERITPIVSVGNLRDRSRISVSGGGTSPIAVSAPESWTRTEVSGVPLGDVKGDPPAFGFVRWTLPAGTIVFESPERIDHLELFNPSGLPMHVILRRTDILTGLAREETILVQESPTKLF
jgi:hypothetical protein